MRNNLLSACVLFSLLFSYNGIGAEAQSSVMLFGVFHFANPGLDKVKTDQFNVMTEENQIYLEELAVRLSQYKPTIVLLEYEPEADHRVNERYKAYLDGGYELSSNEIYQLGFRIAKAAGHQRVHTFDDRGIGWDAEPLFEYMDKVDTETKSLMDTWYERVTIESNENIKTLSFKELLALTNDLEQDNHNKMSYLLTNQVGTDEKPVGATATASWWHRNFRMFAKIQRHALSAKDQRVLVIGGQGHTAILKDFLSLDDRLESVDVASFL